MRIFDISDIKNPKQVAAVQSCRGSHTHTLVEDPNDNPRETNVAMVVQVSWTDRKGGLVGQGGIPIPANVAELGNTGKLIPEYGQSGVTAEQQAIQRMAEQIVALMEMPW